MSEEEEAERDGTVGAMSEEEEKEEAEWQTVGAMREEAEEEKEAEQTVGAMSEEEEGEEEKEEGEEEKEEAEQRPGLSSGTFGATSCEAEEAEQETELSEGVRVPGAEVFPREPVPVPPSKPGTRGTRPAGGDEVGAPRLWAPDLKHESGDSERERARARARTLVIGSTTQTSSAGGLHFTGRDHQGLGGVVAAQTQFVVEDDGRL